MFASVYAMRNTAMSQQTLAGGAGAHIKTHSAQHVVLVDVLVVVVVIVYVVVVVVANAEHCKMVAPTPKY